MWWGFFFLLLLLLLGLEGKRGSALLCCCWVCECTRGSINKHDAVKPAWAQTRCREKVRHAVDELSFQPKATVGKNGQTTFYSREEVHEIGSFSNSDSCKWFTLVRFNAILLNNKWKITYLLKIKRALCSLCTCVMKKSLRQTVVLKSNRINCCSMHLIEVTCKYWTSNGIHWMKV